MDISIPAALSQELGQFRDFLVKHLLPDLPRWYRSGEVPRDFYRLMGAAGWFGFEAANGRLERRSALREALVMQHLAKVSGGVAVAMLVQSDLGLMGLHLFGSPVLQDRYAASALAGDTLICLGNTEARAGSDVAGIETTARKVKGGWCLNGVKAYVTSGLISDLALVTAVSEPAAERTRRMSMLLVDLGAPGVSRARLPKQVWIPSDLTRLQFRDVFVPEDHLVGPPGRGLQQVLAIFSYSRVAISALTLGTAEGAFELALTHAGRRTAFGRRLFEFQAKAFEMADLYAELEAARLMLYKACGAVEAGGDFRLEASLAKYLAVKCARRISSWAADLFGAASVVFEHPVHKFPMDAWGAALGEGTQDIQKLVIFREMMKRFRP